MNTKFSKCIDLSLALFDINYPNRCQVFCFVYYGNKLLTVGRNQNKTHSLNVRNPRIGRNGEIVANKGTCAELAGLTKIRNTSNIKFNKLTLINVRLDRNKNLVLSKPCNSCANLFKFLTPKNVFFSNNHGVFEEFII